MAASISRTYATNKFITSCSFSRLTAIRYRQKRFLKEAVAIPPPKYSINEKGFYDQPDPQPFPKCLDMDPKILEQCERDPLQYPKRHAGLMFSRKPPFLPEQLVNNARHILTENDLICSTSFAAEVRHLLEVYLRRQPPMDNADKEYQRQMIAKALWKEEFENTEFTFEDLSQEQQQKLRKKINGVSKKIFSKTFHNWKHIDYSKRMAYVYMAARLTLNFTVLHHIFHELSKLDEMFEPTAVLNVGSGTGSAIWAGDNVWGRLVREYYNVDTSRDMNDIARTLLAKDVYDPDNLSVNGVFFRQNIPSPKHSENQFPLVVSAYLLMEIPDRIRRLEMIASLWELTQDYLVLVEHGTNAGYLLIQEAKEIIFQMKNDNPAFKGHVLAPCTHDFLCPKLQFKKSPCTFTTDYRQLNINIERGQGDTLLSERFSYVIMKKGPKPRDDQYPRLTHTIRKTKCTHSHICCPDGTLRHYVFTKHKPSPHLFRCVNKSRAGDLLPVLWPQPVPGEVTQHNNEQLQLDDQNRSSGLVGSEMNSVKGDSGELSQDDQSLSETGEVTQTDNKTSRETIQSSAAQSDLELIENITGSDPGETVQVDTNLSSSDKNNKHS